MTSREQWLASYRTSVRERTWITVNDKVKVIYIEQFSVQFFIIIIKKRYINFEDRFLSHNLLINLLNEWLTKLICLLCNRFSNVSIFAEIRNWFSSCFRLFKFWLVDWLIKLGRSSRKTLSDRKIDWLFFITWLTS